MVITFNLSYAPVEALNYIIVDCEHDSDNINVTKSVSLYDRGYSKGSCTVYWCFAIKWSYFAKVLSSFKLISYLYSTKCVVSRTLFIYGFNIIW